MRPSKRSLGAGGPGWREGDLLHVRGRRWRVSSASAGEGCTALRLLRAPHEAPAEVGRAASESPPAAVLLVPFDRPVAVSGSRRIRFAAPARLVDALGWLSAAAHPAHGIRSAAGADVELLPHQLATVLALVAHGATRVLVTDDVGLGKTVQSGLAIAELGVRDPDLRALVLAPAGLRRQWIDELERRVGVRAVPADADWLRAACSDRPPDVNPWGLGGVYVASHDFVKRPDVLRPLEEVAWDLLVVDEAHAVAPGTDRRAAVHAVACRSRRVLLLTATPPWHDARAFDALCDIGRHGRGDVPVLHLHRRRNDVSDAVRRRSSFHRVAPSAAERRMHALLDRYTGAVWAECRRRRDEAAALVAVVLRKRALSSAASLEQSVRRRLDLLAAPPAYSPEQLALPLTEEDPVDDRVHEGTLALPGLADHRQEREWLSAIAAAAGEAARDETKARWVRRLLSRVHEPILVFTEYRDTLARLEAIAASAGRLTLTLHGGMSPSERARVQAVFNAGGAVLLATDAASEGLNLHRACRTVIHYELPWNVARLEQRAGRLDRLGQSRQVREIALIADHTAERLVLAPLARKAAEARRRGRSAGFLQALTEERVAATVLDPSPHPAEDVTTAEREPSPPAPALDAEAVLEARRLEHVRQWIVRLERAPAQESVHGCPVLVVTARRATLAPGLILVYATSVHDGGGAVLSRSVVTLHVTLGAGCPVQRRRSLLRRALQVIAGSPPRDVRTLLDRTIEHERDAAHAFCERARGLLLRRNEQMLSVSESAARELVQAGLFDGRAVMDVRRRQQVSDEQRRSAAARLSGAASPPHASISLAAAVLVRPPRRSP